MHRFDGNNYVFHLLGYVVPELLEHSLASLHFSSIFETFYAHRVTYCVKQLVFYMFHDYVL